MNKVIIGFLCISFVTQASAASYVTTESSVLTKEETDLLETIQKIYTDFKYSFQVIRHYAVDEKGLKDLVLTEVMVDKTRLEYGREYIGYSISLLPYSNIVHYSFDSGTASRGEGTYTVMDRHVTKIDRSCGTSACITSIYIDGKLIKEINVDSTYYK